MKSFARVLSAVVFLLWSSVTLFAAGVVGSGTAASCTEAALNAALAGGGAVTFNCGASPVTITITTTKTISANTSIDGGERITISGGGTVALFDVTPGTTFSVIGLTLADGFRSGDSGAAIKVGTIGNGGTLNITRSTLRNNVVTGGGGGAVTILGASVLTIVDSTFTGNRASSQGAALFTTVTSTSTLTNVTISGNGQVGGANGGIAASGTMTLTNVTIANNISDLGNSALTSYESVTLRNTIVANNQGGNCATVSGVIVDGGNNLQFPGTSCGGTIPTADPLLGPLASNGGPTQTRAISAISPAIDAGNDAVAPPNDQRGMPRFDGNGNSVVQSDIGAYEAGADALSAIPSLSQIALLALALTLAVVAAVALRSC